jgi:large subunit ribosomal protein L10
MTRHVAAWKRKQLAELKQLADSYPVIAVASLTNFPASLFQQLRKKLHGKAVIRVSKSRVIKKAFEQSNIDAGKLNNYVEGSVAVIFTSMNPFELYSFLKRNKGSVAAKEGMIATEDIVVPAGDTGLPPGPALSDLKAAGLKVMVQGPTIHVAEDKVVTKKGEAVSAPVAGTLAKLDIKPVKVGLSVIACYENKEVFEASVLDIDAEKVMENFMKAYTSAFNLAFNAGYFTSQTTLLMLQKAFREAKAVALEAKVLSPETIAELLGVATRQAASLKSSVGEAKEEKKEDEKEQGGKENAGEAATEEKKEEAAEKAAEAEKGEGGAEPQKGENE